MGLVGPGFVGAHHIDAVRRLGFVDVVAVAGSTEESARRKADALGVPKAYGSYEALARDPESARARAMKAEITGDVH
jgi:predicted dehydrogenase